MTKPTVFVHTSCHEIMSGKIAAYSLKRMSKNTDKFDVKIIELEHYPHLMKYHGYRCIRNKREAAWYNNVPQSFLPLRFIVPQLMGYEGKAVVIDPDIFAVADIYELLTKDMGNKAVLARPIYSKNRVIGHNSSVMLLDCSKLQHWQWEKEIDEVFNKKRDLQEWISIQTESRENIGELEEEWNHYDILNEHTKLLHNTTQITQPWKTGLLYDTSRLNNNVQGFARFGIELVSSYQKIAKAPSKRKALKSMMQELLLQKERKLYRQHPDPNQENLFFSYLKEALLEGIISEDFIKQQINYKHIRKDIFEILNKVNYSTENVLQRITKKTAKLHLQK
ncbi:unknown [Crocosphaera subtropica ATCC 51142]|uniref:Glycosyl transferase n=1 Tax=Crocosphaera subtropica (strain ATCC 51142 / BH68) TaxID=43989 RepID=B1WVB7_CROS5|nr:hypothetical protein [Crocosphaera subtropica]ACB53907.1 unknown [Crocosphaera subtropica ATCC 51142]